MVDRASHEAPSRQADGWPTAALRDAPFDPLAFSTLDRLFEQGEYPNTHALLVEYAGTLVYERYFEGEDEVLIGPPVQRVFTRESLHDLRSVSKSVTSILLGLALEGDYETALATPISAFFGDLDITYGAGTDQVTLYHVLTMTAGIEWDQWSLPYSDPANDSNRHYEAADPFAMVLSRPVVHPPGSVWVYSGGLTQLLVGIVERRTGKPFLDFAEEALFGPLGIADYQWLGSPHWNSSAMPAGPWGLRMRARDLAKFGSLFLHEGAWQAKQVVPAEWVGLSSHRHVTKMPWGSDGVYGYGFQWWSGRSRSLPPYRIFRAAGNGGQRVLVVPERQIVVTAFAGNYDRNWQNNGDRVLGRVAAAFRRDS